MARALIVDLRRPLRDFVDRLRTDTKIPSYVLKDVIELVFDVLIFELENAHEEPELHRLGNFYRDYLENDPVFLQRFLGSFFLLVKNIAGHLRSHGFYDGNGFSYYPEKNCNNRSIVVRKFEDDERS